MKQITNNLLDSNFEPILNQDIKAAIWNSPTKLVSGENFNQDIKAAILGNLTELIIDREYALDFRRNIIQSIKRNLILESLIIWISELREKFDMYDIFMLSLTCKKLSEHLMPKTNNLPKVKICFGRFIPTLRRNFFHQMHFVFEE